MVLIPDTSSGQVGPEVVPVQNKTGDSSGFRCAGQLLSHQPAVQAGETGL